MTTYGLRAAIHELLDTGTWTWASWGPAAIVTRVTATPLTRTSTPAAAPAVSSVTVTSSRSRQLDLVAEAGALHPQVQVVPDADRGGAVRPP